MNNKFDTPTKSTIKQTKSTIKQTKCIIEFKGKLNIRTTKSTISTKSTIKLKPMYNFEGGPSAKPLF
jgi:hypothetical protein